MWTSKWLAASCLIPTANVITGNAWAASLNLDFSGTGGTVLDRDGAGTGFTARLAGTGQSLPASDTRLNLDTSSGTLAITSGATQESFDG
jgi:hypothetical protein